MQNKSFRTSISAAIILFMVVGMLAVTPFAKDDAAYAATSQFTLSGVTKPGTLKKGQAFVIKGMINSALTMSRVEVGIVKDGKWVSGCYANKYPKSRSFNIFTADSSIAFGNLAPGTYYYRIWAHDANGGRKVLDHKFVVSSTTATSKITLSGVTKPGTLTKGKSFMIKGTVNSALAIKQMSVGIATSDGKKWIPNHIVYKYPRLLSFNIGSVSSLLKFSNLAAGSYRYKVFAYDANGAHLIIDQPFKVVAPAAPVANPSTSLSISKLKNYTDKNWNTNTNRYCAEYVYYCLNAAGYTLPKVTYPRLDGKVYGIRTVVGSQLNYLDKKTPYKVIWNPKYQEVKNNWVRTNIKPGDIVFYDSNTKGWKKHAEHVVICTRIDSNNWPRYSAHNNCVKDGQIYTKAGKSRILAVVKMGMK